MRIAGGSGPRNVAERDYNRGIGIASSAPRATILDSTLERQNVSAIGADRPGPSKSWRHDRRVWAVCGALAVAIGLVFGQTAVHDFIGFDDDGYVAQNEFVTPGLTLSGLRWALTDGPLGEWCPLTVLSHMLDCQLYGLHPGGHHLTSVLLHAASSILLFLIMLLTSQRAVPAPTKGWSWHKRAAGGSRQRARARQHSSERCPTWHKRAAGGSRQRARARQHSGPAPGWPQSSPFIRSTWNPSPGWPSGATC